MITAGRVSMTPMRLNMMNVGIISSWIGTMIVATIKKNVSVAAGEPQPGEAVSGQTAEHEMRHHGDDRHDRRVDQPAHDVGVVEQIVIAGEADPGRKELWREPVDVAVGHERREDHPHQRQREQQRRRHQQQVPARERKPAATPRDDGHQNASIPDRREYQIMNAVIAIVTAKTPYAIADP